MPSRTLLLVYPHPRRGEEAAAEAGSLAEEVFV
jgi:hypothetical protein